METSDSLSKSVLLKMLHLLLSLILSVLKKIGNRTLDGPSGEEGIDESPAVPMAVMPKTNITVSIIRDSVVFRSLLA